MPRIVKYTRVDKSVQIRGAYILQSPTASFTGATATSTVWAVPIAHPVAQEVLRGDEYDDDRVERRPVRVGRVSITGTYAVVTIDTPGAKGEWTHVLSTKSPVDRAVNRRQLLWVPVRG